MPSVQVPRASQQPPQFCGPQRPMPWHCPPPPADGPQVVPCAVQFWQAAPRLPQACPSVPVRHWSPTQQPAQFEASHFRAVLQVRRRLSHAWPWPAQSVHEAPPCPHAVASVPGKHTPVPPDVTQQPAAQLVASHVGTRLPHAFREGSHTSWPAAMQSEHFPPSPPHACTSVPTRHTPRTSQQPLGQVDGPHVPASPPESVFASASEPSRMGSSRLDRPHPDPAAATALPKKASDATKRATREKGEGDEAKADSFGMACRPRGPLLEFPRGEGHAAGRSKA